MAIAEALSRRRGDHVVGDKDDGAVSDFNFFEAVPADSPKAPTKVSSRTFAIAAGPGDYVSHLFEAVPGYSLPVWRSQEYVLA
ncbi:hypothetical protein [Pseudarthrobacter siccitolerans]